MMDEVSFILFFSYFSPARRVQRGRMTALARVAFTHEPTRTFHFSYTIGARIKKSSGLLCRKQRPDSTAPFRRVQLVEIQKEKRERGNEPLLVRRVTNKQTRSPDCTRRRRSRNRHFN